MEQSEAYKLTVAQLVKTSPPFTEPQGLLPFPSLHNFLHPSATSSPLGPNILLSTHNKYSYLSVRDQVSHPYKTTGITVLFCTV